MVNGDGQLRSRERFSRAFMAWIWGITEFSLTLRSTQTRDFFSLRIRRFISIKWKTSRKYKYVHHEQFKLNAVSKLKHFRKCYTEHVNFFTSSRLLNFPNPPSYPKHASLPCPFINYQHCDVIQENGSLHSHQLLRKKSRTVIAELLICLALVCFVFGNSNIVNWR